MNVRHGLHVGAGALVIALSAAHAVGCSSSSSGPADGGGGNAGDTGPSETDEGGSSSSSGAASSSGSSGSSGGSSSGASSGGSSSGAMDQEGGSTSSSGGGGSCDAGILSYDMPSASSCIASSAPHMPSGFTAGHCPSGANGCCFKEGPCGFTSNCDYGLPSQLVSGAMTQCTNGGGTWQASPP